MSGRHAATRRRTYGRRGRDLRERHLPDVTIDLEGPTGWTRGSGWSGQGSPSGTSEPGTADGSGGGR